MPIEILKKLPKKAREMWESTYSAAKTKYGEERAAKIAWTAVRAKFKKTSEGWVAKFIGSPQYSKVVYQFMATEGSVSKSLDGVIYRDYVLSSNKVDKVNQAFSDFALKRMSEQINQEKVKGRVDDTHILWKKLKEEGLTPEEIEARLQEEDTGIEAVSAKYENGKLIARIKFTEAAFEKAKDYAGASVEARYPEGSFREGVFHQARLQGFVLTNNPANSDAVALS